jgi:hypothetical protein
MQAEFSSFSYAVAVLRELSSTLDPDLVAGLLLPHLGWAHAEASSPTVGWPLFLHFRLAEHMLTPRATGWSEHEERFFRLAVPAHSGSEHHDLLRRFSEVEPEVYYVVPAFYRRSEFARALASEQVLQGSRFIPLRSLPDASESRTLYITYSQDEPGLRWFTVEEESQQLDTSVEAGDWLTHVQELLRQPRRLGWRFGLDLRESLLRCLRDRMRQPRLFDELMVDLDTVIPSAVLRDLRYLLQAHFGLQTLIVHPA